MGSIRLFGGLSAACLLVATVSTYLLVRRDLDAQRLDQATDVALAAVVQLEERLGGSWTGPDLAADGAWVLRSGDATMAIEALRRELQRPGWRLVVLDPAVGQVVLDTAAVAAPGADLPQAPSLVAAVPPGATSGRLPQLGAAYRQVPDSDGWSLVAVPDGVAPPAGMRPLPLLPLGALLVVMVTGGVLLRMRDRDLRAREALDPLTELPNKDALLAAVGRADGRAALVRIDLVELDRINRTEGRSAGERIQRHAGERLAGVVRGGDVVARIGDGEFGVLLDGVEDERAARFLARRLCRTLSEPFELDGRTLSAPPALGVALTAGGDAADELLGRADVALQAAGSSPTALVVWEEALGRHVDTAPRIVAELRRALEQDALDVAYQPIVALDGGGIVTLEALARWTHPTHGAVSPTVFVPAAESAGLVPLLTERVLELAVRDVVAWRDQGHDVRVSVNLSALDLIRRDLPDDIGRVLERHGCPPSAVQLEITESALISDLELASAVLGQLRQRGLSLAIDDFGTGYSSLVYLRSFPVTDVKIDRSFVAGGLEEHSDELIVRSTIELAHLLGLGVTAEGLEHEAARTKLVGWGCDQAQGHLLARPMPGADVPALLRSGLGGRKAGAPPTLAPRAG